MCLDDGRVVSNFVAQVLSRSPSLILSFCFSLLEWVLSYTIFFHVCRLFANNHWLYMVMGSKQEVSNTFLIWYIAVFVFFCIETLCLSILSLRAVVFMSGLQHILLILIWSWWYHLNFTNEQKFMVGRITMNLGLSNEQDTWVLGWRVVEHCSLKAVLLHVF